MSNESKLGLFYIETTLQTLVLRQYYIEKPIWYNIVQRSY